MMSGGPTLYPAALRSLAVGLAGVALGWGPPAARARNAFEVVRQEQSCPKTTDAHSIRQTIVVLDEAIVEDKPDANQRWTRMIVEAADAREVSVRTLGTRERLTVLAARRDGSELVPIFVGCSPNRSPEEIERDRQKDTALQRFTGTDSVSRLKAERADFSGGLARALAQVQRQASEMAAEPVRQGGFLHALQNVGRLAAPEYGIVRFILVTPFGLPDRAALRDVPSARDQGFAQAAKAALDLGRSEIYIAGASLGDSPAEQYARALFLGSKGNLVAFRSDGLPTLGPEPVSSRVYEGFIDYVGQRAPMQMRLAKSSSGDLVNSWVEIALMSRTTATPLGGKALCRGNSNDDCEVRDERFATVWFSDPGAEPADRGKLPFGGARFMELKTGGDLATGRVHDPKVLFQPPGSTDKPLDSLPFEIHRVDGSPF